MKWAMSVFDDFMLGADLLEWAFDLGQCLYTGLRAFSKKYEVSNLRLDVFGPRFAWFPELKQPVAGSHPAERLCPRSRAPWTYP